MNLSDEWIERYIDRLALTWHPGDGVPTFSSKEAVIQAASELYEYLGADRWRDLNRIMEFLFDGAYAMIKADEIKDKKAFAKLLAAESARIEKRRTQLIEAGASASVTKTLGNTADSLKIEAQAVLAFHNDPDIPAINAGGTDSRRLLRATIEAIVRALPEIGDDKNLKILTYNLALAISGADPKYDFANDAATLISQVVEKISIVPAKK
ncbi:MAG: hypothetical protein GXP05_16515 [Alphaproteobacteria bacterium]|nr:hypothetical protein [Alphaproteobacteria bacterium]